jgi:diguanylate cyclase (GGDEF)-like protein
MARDFGERPAAPGRGDAWRLPWRAGGREIAARLGELMLLGGVMIFVAAALILHSPQAQVGWYWVLAALLLVAAAIVVALPPQVRAATWIPRMIVAAGILAISAGIYFNGERLGGPPAFSEFFYIWPAFYIGYFFTRRALAIWLLVIAAAYGGVLVAIDDTGVTGVTRWIVTMSVVSGAALALHVLRRHVDRLLTRLREAARTDPLTALLNRGGFDERFELEMDRARRTGDPFAILVGDLDRFKDLNDRFGHASGDTALVAVAQALANGSRSIDTVARVGGEEFALLLPASDATGGVEAAERLRVEISQIVASDGQPLTISFGVVEFPRHGETPEELLDAADGALYTAKALGRDRTVSGEPERAPATA